MPISPFIQQLFSPQLSEIFFVNAGVKIYMKDTFIYKIKVCCIFETTKLIYFVQSLV